MEQLPQRTTVWECENTVVLREAGRLWCEGVSCSALAADRRGRGCAGAARAVGAHARSLAAGGRERAAPPPLLPRAHPR